MRLSYHQLDYLCVEFSNAKAGSLVLTCTASQSESDSGVPLERNGLRINVLSNGSLELLTPDYQDSKRGVVAITVSLIAPEETLKDVQERVLIKLVTTIRKNLLLPNTRIDTAQVQGIVDPLILRKLLSDNDTSSNNQEIAPPFPLSEPDWIQIAKGRDLLKRAFGSRHVGVDSDGTDSTSKAAIDVDFAKQNLLHSTTEKTSLNSEISMTNHSIGRSTGFFASPPKISPDRFRILRKHVINLNRGKFSQDGDFTSSHSSMQAIFDRHIPEWMSTRSNERLDIVLYSHGGLTNEGWGLATANKQIDWWKSNGVYPIFFVWETGLLETIWQLLQANWFDAPRGFLDGIKDAIAEANDGFWQTAFRASQLPTVWAGMKASAQLAFDEDADGDGVSFLESLADYFGESDLDVRLHAVGHSAGSIFLARAIAAANRIWEDYPKFESVHFLAPAITTQLFRQTLLPIIGNGEEDQIKHLSVFTMNDAFEKDDTVGPYRKSLLYLIHHALEPAKETHLVGLEHSLASEPDMSRFFGLTGNSNVPTDLVLSVTSSQASQRNRSKSTTHGGFDDDPATMESVCRRIIDSDHADGFSPFPIDTRSAPTVIPASPTNAQPNWQNSASYKLDNSVNPTVSQNAHRAGNQNGRRSALCIGINHYPVNRLSGCESDAKRWSERFDQMGFTVDLVLSHEATRDRISDSIESLFARAQAGDIVAIQFAGHGTTVPDDNHDEFRGDTPGRDEALVPIDYQHSGLLLDDDIGELCRAIPDGVNVTFFFDCCHSGTATRMFMSSGSSHGTARYLPPSESMIEANRKTRLSRGAKRSGANPYTGRQEILFAACKSGEVAYESGGQGDFTRTAMNIFDRHGMNLTCEDFHRLVLQEFGGTARQTPGLWCDESLESTLLLGGRGTTKPNDQLQSAKGEPTGNELLADLRSLLNKYST